MLKNDLQQLGLSEKDAKVYLACLDIGRGSAQQISSLAGVPKSTTADTLVSLNKRGLVSMYFKKGTRYFTASNPVILKDKINRQQRIIDKMLPYLQGMFFDSQKQKPESRFYEGKDGVRIVLKEILEEANDLISMSSVEDIFAKLPEYFPSFSKNRVKRKIPIRIIARDSTKARDRQSRDVEELREIKIVELPIVFHSAVYIWNHKLAMITLGDYIAVYVIESRDLVQTFRFMFEAIWSKY